MTPVHSSQPDRPSKVTVLLGILAVFLMPGLHAAHFTITNPNDSGPGSLHQAIKDANDNGEADTITFSDGSGGTTNFHDSEPETIGFQGSVLRRNYLRILDDFTITGPGIDKLVVSGNSNGDLNVDSGESGVFYTQNEVRLEHFTITKGVDYLGRNINNRGDFTLENCVISEGRGDGADIYNLGDGMTDGHLQVHGAVGNGKPATVTLENCIVANSFDLNSGTNTHDFVSTTINGGTASAGGQINLIESHSGFDIGITTFTQDPELDSLLENGGLPRTASQLLRAPPSTPVIQVFLAKSPTINAARAIPASMD